MTFYIVCPEEALHFLCAVSKNNPTIFPIPHPQLERSMILMNFRCLSYRHFDSIRTISKLPFSVTVKAGENLSSF